MREGRSRDDRGIALISVMICIMLCFLLSATIMRVSYLSYLQKSIGKETTKTFYENETYVDDLKLGIQTMVVQAANSVTTSDANPSQTFVNTITGAFGSTKSDIESRLSSFLNADTGIKSIQVLGDGTDYIKLENGGKEVVIKNVELDYEDPVTHYISKIQTDIRIRAPYYQTEITTTETGGRGYSVVAANGAIIGTGAGRGNLQQGGDLYFGYRAGTATAVKVGDDWVVDHATAAEISNGMLYWLTGDAVIYNGDIILDASTLMFTGGTLTIRGTITLKNKSHLVLGSGSKIVCRDIVVDGKSAASGTYEFADNGGEITGPPVDFNGENSARTTWFGKASSIDVYTGNGNPGNGKTHKKASSSDITFQSDLRPVTNVNASGNPLSSKSAIEGTGEQYDKVFYDIVDVAYMKAITDFSNKTQKGYINSYTAENSDDTGKWSNFQGYTANTTEFPTIEGKKIGVNFGNNIQTINNEFGYFMINWSTGTQKIGTLNINNAMQTVFYGMLFARGSMEMVIQNPKLGIGTSFVDYYDGDVDKAKRVLKYLGRSITTDSGINQDTSQASQLVREKNCLNNMFRNGILSLLGDGATTTHESVETTVDIVRNASLDSVTFENWQKK
ncbi:MAG: hypothetical protein IJM57_07000 [Lachnospiraceae bacterium]|nr:hypothetical protein [Lachnospiraceae bacterium]